MQKEFETMRRLPDFVIIGAQKSASTFIQVCLDDRPEIFLPAGEVAVFESPDYQAGGIDTLVQLCAGRSEKCVGIKRPAYLGKPEVPARITKHLPDAKLIAVLRNPVDRATSAYFHNIRYGFLPVLGIEEGMRRLIGDAAFHSKYKRGHEVIDFGYYFKHLRRYDSYLASGRLLVLLHDDMVSDPLGSIQRAYGFIGVAADYRPTSLTARPQAVLYRLPRLWWVSLSNGLKYRYNVDRTRLFEKDSTRFGNRLSRIIQIVDSRILASLFPDRRPVVSVELRRTLYSLYANDIRELEKYFARDLSSWRPEGA